MARILYFYRKNDDRWIEEKEHHEKELSLLGKYIHISILNKNSSSKACDTPILVIGYFMGKFPLLNDCHKVNPIAIG